MNAHLKHLLERADHWPATAQRELEQAALEIERRLVSTDHSATTTLLELMRKSPLAEVDIERKSNNPAFRDVVL